MRETSTTIVTGSQLAGSETSKLINGLLDQYVFLQLVC
jgi:hypothetical protein